MKIFIHSIIKIIFSLSLFKATLCQNFQDVDFVLERPNLPEISKLEVECGQDRMTVRVAFSSSFQGMLFSKGQFGNENCVYVQPFSGERRFEFKIYYDGCGTKPDLGGRFYENTIIIQYDPDLIEMWDEAKRLRCEWYNDYEKTASKPPVVIADLDVIELNFRGDNVDAWMEIQDGKGPWASPIGGIVPLGSTLTMVIAINDRAGQFDMRVKSCEASDGNNSPIYLTDEEGCVLRPKMLSKFMKVRNNDGRATVISYAYFHAFKFPDSMTVHMRCKTEICRYGCPDHCPAPGEGHGSRSSQLTDERNYYELPHNRLIKRTGIESGGGASNFSRVKGDDLEKIGLEDFDLDQTDSQRKNSSEILPTVVANQKEAREYLKNEDKGKERIELPNRNDFPWGPRSLFRKRRHTEDKNVGVNTEYQVISEADLEFTLNRNAPEGVTIFKGKREDIIYGICLPAPGFSALFVFLSMCTVISVLVAGFMCHHRQIQKDCVESPAIPHVNLEHSSPRSVLRYIREHLQRSA